MKRVLGLLVLVAVLSLPALAADIVMTANNAGNYSSFNMDVNWSPAGVPVAGNNYFTKGYLMRSPANGTGYLTGDFTFAGDSLTIGRGAVPAGTTGYGDPFLTTGAVNNNCLIFKTSGQNLTVNNLILDAGTIRDGLGTNQTASMNGNIFVTANGGGFAAQCLLSINSVISGSGTIYINDNGSGEAGRTVFFTGQNTYNGNINLLGTTAVRSRLSFSDNSMMNFVIGASGVNNKITVGSGKMGTVNYDGDFAVDLTAAGINVGDSWALSSVTSQIFGATFTVVGFADMGNDTWRKYTNGVWYEFSEATGALSVIPEPATMLLLGLGGLLVSRKKR
jgi:hypothetical protein